MSETSEVMCQRVQAARNIQQARFANPESSNVVCNADIPIGEVRDFCSLEAEGQSLMRAAADLAGSEDIQSVHLTEALHASQSSEIMMR